MKVILREAVPKLGKPGEIKEVRMGYGFNFLIPKKLAELATSSNVKRVLAWVKKETAKRTEALAGLKDTVAKLEGVRIIIKMKAENGKLFGSVGKAEIVEALKEKGIVILEDVLSLARPIKKVGEHTVEVKAGTAEADLIVVVEAE
jgi:large subunit ribosomal protein L9